MKTVTILIGNSDDKLSQARWAAFQNRMAVLAEVSGDVQFSGTSAPNAPWQNAAWVVVCGESMVEAFRQTLKDVAREFGQDSIALVVGETEFIEKRI